MSVIKNSPVAAPKPRAALNGQRKTPSSRAQLAMVFLFLLVGFAFIPADAQITEYLIPSSPARPQGIRMAPDGAYWFTEYGTQRIGRIDTNGVVTEPFLINSNAGPFAMVIGTDSNIWFTETLADKLGRISRGTNGSFTNGILTEFPIHAPGHTNTSPGGLTVGPDGNFWFVEYSAGIIGVMDTNGILLHEYGAQTSPGTIQTNAQLYNITSGSDGNLWFTEVTYGKIGQITPAGIITEFTLPGSNCEPFDIVAGSDGAMWFSEANSNRIGRLTTGGVYTNYTLPSTNVNSILNFSQQPYNVTRASDGNVWFTEFSGSQIGRITPAGVITEFPTPTFGSAPTAITSGSDGGIWFGEYANAIGRFALPTLTISVDTNSQAILMWPSFATAYTLQGNTNLSTTNWVNLTSPPPVVISNFFVYSNSAVGYEFFRLVAP